MLNRYRFIRDALSEIYEKRDGVIKTLCEEIDKHSGGDTNVGKAYYNHLKLLLTELKSLNPYTVRENSDIFPYPPDYIFVETNFGFKLPVSGLDMTSVHSFGYFEPSETVLMQRIAKYANVLFDVGANIGYFSLLFKQFTEADSVVFAFEPENFNYEKLAAAVDRNNFMGEIKTYKLAVSNESATSRLYINKRGSGGHSLLKVQPEIFTDEYEDIETITLDDFVKGRKIDISRSILKIDIEGAEGKALEGAHNLLKTGKPLAILCEIWKDGVVPNVETVNKILSYGYNGYSVQKPGVDKPLIKPVFTGDDFNSSYNNNYFFIRNDSNVIEEECLVPLKWNELASDFLLRHVVTTQEKALIDLTERHSSIVSEKVSRFIKHYISASDGGFPLFKKEDHPAVVAKIRFHHNSGGPAVLTFIDRKSLDVITSVVVGESQNFKDKDGHYHTPDDKSTEIVMTDILNYRPDIVLLMPNNATSFLKEELEQLRKKHIFYLAARDGDPIAHSKDRIEKNLKIAEIADLFISVDGAFVDTGYKRGFNNIEYIPSFVNEHFLSYKKKNKTIDILFAGYGGEGLTMDDGCKMYEKRRNFIKRVNDEYDKRLKVIGRGWEDLGLANWLNEFIAVDALQHYINISKIVIAYDGPFSKGFTSVRVFRALTTGSFVLIKYFPGIENLFENHIHLVWFHSDEEALRLIDYYLKNDDEREKIAQNGRQYLIDHPGWRRKNIIVDYLVKKYSDPYADFGNSFGSYARPINLKGNKKFNQLLKSEKFTGYYFNLYDLLLLAEEFINRKKYPEAEILLKQIIEYDPNMIAALNDFSVLEILKEKYSEALTLLKKTLTLDPQNSIALSNYQYLQNIMDQI